MIPDSETNFLYLADSLPEKYPAFYQQFEKVLNSCHIQYRLLRHTKDVWAVVYMPKQVDLDTFVRFIYNPKYLQSKKYLKTISDTDTICEQIGINTIQSGIVLDGGNVIRTTLKKKLKQVSPTLPETLCIRLHRAVSWLKCAEENNANPDLQFITLWISYNSCYAIDEKHESIATEKDRYM